MSDLRQLVALVSSTCPPQSARVQLNAEVDYGWAAIEIHYTAGPGDRVRAEVPIDTSFKLQERLEELWEEMAIANGARWQFCELVIDPDGGFRFDVR